eukprot:SAG11_NODE_1585_length_4639_cov_1.547357_3_plen_141_part_00
MREMSTGAASEAGEGGAEADFEALYSEFESSVERRIASVSTVPVAGAYKGAKEAKKTSGCGQSTLCGRIFPRTLLRVMCAVNVIGWLVNSQRGLPSADKPDERGAVQGDEPEPQPLQVHPSFLCWSNRGHFSPPAAWNLK